MNTIDKLKILKDVYGSNRQVAIHTGLCEQTIARILLNECCSNKSKKAIERAYERLRNKLKN